MQNVSYINYIIVVVLLLATLTYFFVERPFRNRTLFSRKHVFFISSIGALIIFLVASFLIRTANNRSLSKSEEVDTYLRDIEPFELVGYTIRRFDDHVKKYPTFSNQSALTNRRVVLIGDSFAQEFMNMAMETHNLVDYEIRCHYVKYDCQIYIGSEDRLQWIPPPNREFCIGKNDVRFALPLIREANIIILAGCWLHWSAKRLPKTIELLNLTQSQKLFVLGMKNFGDMDRRLYINKSYEYRIRQLQQPQEHAVKVNTMMKQALDKSIFVDVLSMTCTFYNGTCPVFTPHGKLISYDGWHVTKYGARYIGDIIFRNFPLNQL